MSTGPRRTRGSEQFEPVAGNGLLDRRLLLRARARVRRRMTAGAARDRRRGRAAEGRPVEPRARHHQPAVEPRSHFEDGVSARSAIPRASRARSTRARRTICSTARSRRTSLHFTIIHTGMPDIDPAKHRLVIHGLVKQPLVFTLDALLRYPMVSRMAFVECGGNSAPMFSNEPIQATAAGTARPGLLRRMDRRAALHPARRSRRRSEGEMVDRRRRRRAALNRSVPLTEGLDDAMIALYQNGERIMPGNGYPMRLLLPGYEGNMNVKFLRRLKLVDQPAMSYYESRNYSPLLPGGKAYKFYFLQEVKSFITQPSFGQTLKEPGFYEISGIAYSGTGRIAKVMVSADGGKSWAEAALQGPVHPKAFTRFRMPWRWDGGPAVLQSRAWDESGNFQPTARRLRRRARRDQDRCRTSLGFPNQHYNSITSWGVDGKGEIKHVYA